MSLLAFELIKLFHIHVNHQEPTQLIDTCMSSFGLATVSELVGQRKNKFLLKFNLQDNFYLLIYCWWSVYFLTVVATCLHVCFP